MRLGLFGGTFDPVHLGHLIVAEQCREQCELDEVHFLPAANPPHKSHRPLTDARHRAEMLQLAIAGHDSFRLDRRELHRDGPSYTAVTLEQIHNEHPQAELFFLMGTDSLLDLPNWHRPDDICRLATLVTARRRGFSQASSTPDSLTQRPPEITLQAEVVHVDIPAIDIASTDIRARVAAGRSIRYLVPRAVELYIREHQLYT